MIRSETEVPMITVDVWADFACPFCYIGKRNFEKALEAFPGKDRVVLRTRSYELNPDGPSQKSVTSYESIARKRGVSVEESRTMHERITRMAAGAGLTYDFSTVVDATTLDAHRLVHYARTVSASAEEAVIENLFAAHFTEGRDIEDRAVLVETAVRSGLDGDKTREMLESDRHTMDVRHDESEAVRNHVRGVPYFIFSDGTAISGAQPPAAFLEALEKAVR